MKKQSASRCAFFDRRALLILLFCGTACSIITQTLPAFLRLEVAPNRSPRTLSFAERVADERAIEDVYWRHRVWPKDRPDPKPALDGVMSQTQLEKKVTDYLRNSQALENYWQQPITAAQLQTEMERMAQHTHQPEMLHELFEALGNDPFVIAECLARSTLSQRLITNFSVHDQRLHGELKRDTQSWQSTADTQMPRKVPAIDSIAKAVQVNRPYHLPTISGAADCSDGTWTATSTSNAPSSRAGHTAVWTGSEMIVWGGYNGSYLNTGGRYCAQSASPTPTPTPTPTAPPRLAPSPRGRPTSAPRP